MKKAFPTFIHNTAMEHEKIFVSAGKVGYQIEISPKDLVNLVDRCEVVDLLEIR